MEPAGDFQAFVGYEGILFNKNVDGEQKFLNITSDIHFF